MYPVNYSGNRCHTQTKQNNSYMLQLYQEHLANPPQSASLEPSLQVQLCEEAQDERHFPSVVLLMVSDDPWEEQSQRWEHSEPESAHWVSTLIEGE